MPLFRHVSPILSLALIGPWATVNGESVQPLDSIRAAAVQFVESQLAAKQLKDVEVRARRLDERLRLAACDRPLETKLSPAARLSGNTTVGVSCTGSSPWSLYVPLRVTVFERAVVATRALARGETIARDDITLARREVTNLRGDYLGAPSDAIGKRLKRAVTRDTTLTAGMLDIPPQVRRGERVILLAKGSSMQVRMAGKALADGRPGERVKVRNLKSKRIVEGTVAGPGLVRVTM